MSTLLTLGQEVEHEGKPYLIVRIDKSTTLFENEEGKCYKVDEEYVQLRSQYGEIAFIPLFEVEEPFEAKRSTIKALPEQPWRVKK